MPELRKLSIKAHIDNFGRLASLGSADIGKLASTKRRTISGAKPKIKDVANK